MVKSLSNNNGNIQIPVLLIFSLLFFAGIGVLGIVQSWRGLVHTQLRLNRCVGEKAHSLRDVLNRVAKTNQEIKLTRASIAVLFWSPASVAALRATLQGLVFYQDALLLKWKGERAIWFATMGCGLRNRDIARPLPSLEYSRPPPDPIGSQALIWTEGMEMPSEFKLSLENGSRGAYAGVFQSSNLGESARWYSRWLSK